MGFTCQLFRSLPASTSWNWTSKDFLPHQKIYITVQSIPRRSNFPVYYFLINRYIANLHTCVNYLFLNSSFKMRKTMPADWQGKEVAPSANCLLIPISESFACGLRAKLINTLWGLRSRCIIPTLWRCERPSTTSLEHIIKDQNLTIILQVWLDYSHIRLFE